MISIIIPAHNEQTVIQRTLHSLVDGADPGELEIVVVCNGCTDRTAEIARAFGGPVRVLETEIPSKSNALNLGDQAARSFPRIYLDADITLSLESVRQIAAVLERDGALAAAPGVTTVFPPRTSWAVRAYYAFWMGLPYIQEGMMAAGAYAVSEKGRARFDQFPNIIADDGYFRLLFTPEERPEVRTARSIVSAPGRFRDLILIKTRSRLGFYQLKSLFPELFVREAQTKKYGRALWYMLMQPRIWPCAGPYLWVNFISRHRAKRQSRRLHQYVWERDNSSRAQDECAGSPLKTV